MSKLSTRRVRFKSRNIKSNKSQYKATKHRENYSENTNRSCFKPPVLIVFYNKISVFLLLRLLNKGTSLKTLQNWAAEWTEAALCALISRLHIPQVQGKHLPPTAAATEKPVHIYSLDEQVRGLKLQKCSIHRIVTVLSLRFFLNLNLIERRECR